MKIIGEITRSQVAKNVAIEKQIYPIDFENDASPSRTKKHLGKYHEGTETEKNEPIMEYPISQQE
jgi:hypothetical protein